VQEESGQLFHLNKHRSGEPAEEESGVLDFQQERVRRLYFYWFSPKKDFPRFVDHPVPLCWPSIAQNSEEYSKYYEQLKEDPSIV